MQCHETGLRKLLQFFSSLCLSSHLCDQDVKITGTIRSNRLEKCPI